jgi:hypothetical protein
MSRILSLALLAAVASFGVGSTSAWAASPSQQECEAAGGTFGKEQGTVTCTVKDPVGESEASGGKSQTRDVAEKDQGNITPKKGEPCTSGPGNQTTCP